MTALVEDLNEVVPALGLMGLRRISAVAVQRLRSSLVERRHTRHMPPFAVAELVQATSLSKYGEIVQAGLPMSDNCLFQKIEPFSEVKFKI